MNIDLNGLVITARGLTYKGLDDGKKYKLRLSSNDHWGNKTYSFYTTPRNKFKCRLKESDILSSIECVSRGDNNGFEIMNEPTPF